MASLTIRQLDGAIKTRLRVRAALHGRSMEQEVRDILTEALSSEDAPGEHLVDAIRRRFKPVGGVDLPVIAREPIREPARFKE